MLSRSHSKLHAALAQAGRGLRAVQAHRHGLGGREVAERGQRAREVGVGYESPSNGTQACQFYAHQLHHPQRALTPAFELWHQAGWQQDKSPKSPTRPP